MKKLSIIRGKDVKNCPYGLNITQACQNVGDTILEMRALENVDDDEKAEVLKRNRLIYATQKLGARCIFANEIMKQFDTVDCSYGDTAAGEGVVTYTGSPLYPRTFLDDINPNPRGGQDIYDPRLVMEAPDRGIDVPFGLYSIFANRSNEMELIKTADSTNNEANIRTKVAELRNKYLDVLQKIYANSQPHKLNAEQLHRLIEIISNWSENK